MTPLVGCVWEVLDEGSLLVTYCDEAATIEQWRAYVRLMRDFKGRGGVRFLVYAAAVPSREALGDISSMARGEGWTVALISPSVAVRFAAATFAFVVKGFRFFPPDNVAGALAHLGCNDVQVKQALSALARMRGKDISLSPPS
jgi:hypothetical protein